MPVITNRGDIPLGLAVWLLHDEYDFIDEPNYISATGVMRPIKHIVLPPRIPKEQRVQQDVEDFVSSALGKTLHDGIEKAWHKGYRRSLALMGHPKHVIDRVLINPTEQQIQDTKDPILVYLEQRAFRQIVINGEVFTIGGKFDMCAEGIVQDNKSTTAYTWLFGTRDDEHILQGSIYRWLDADGFTDYECTQRLVRPRITEDHIKINYIFTDWQKMQARSNPKYPQSRILYKDLPLMSLEDTEQWIRAKLIQFQKYRNASQEDIPECTDEELWRSAPVFKYYSDPAKTDGRATKNFDDPIEARKYVAEKGKGIVIAIPGEVKRCNYCAAFPICKQKDRYFQ